MFSSLSLFIGKKLGLGLTSTHLGYTIIHIRQSKQTKEARPMLNRICRETEKAIQTEMIFVNPTTDAEFTRKVWVPKSQLSANGIPGKWITSQKIYELVGQDRWKFCCYWEREDGSYVDYELTDKELEAEERCQVAMKAGLEALNELIEYGKAHGVKGLRKGLKKTTVLKKFAQAGVEVPAAA